MSVLLKGIELPKENQRGLWVVIHADGTVEYDSGDEGWKTLKQAAYPVPPHGRLIDADEFVIRMTELVQLAKADGFDLGAHWYAAFIRHIEIAPTIIPAEEDTQKDGGQDDGTAQV